MQSRELGSSVDEVEQLIRRHEAFRKAAAAWEERFSSLRRLTTVSTPFPAPGPTPHSPTSISLYETNTRANTQPPRCVEGGPRQTLTVFPVLGAKRALKGEGTDCHLSPVTVQG